MFPDQKNWSVINDVPTSNEHNDQQNNRRSDNYDNENLNRTLDTGRVTLLRALAEYDGNDATRRSKVPKLGTLHVPSVNSKTECFLTIS